MRGIILMVAAAVILPLAVGCRGRNREVYPREQASAGAPRPNLYPLTSPPPGSVQPLQGYAPTRITASYNDGYAAADAGAYQNAPAGYVAAPQRGGYVQGNTGYVAPAYTGDPYAGMVQNPFTPNGGVCRVEEITAASNPNVPIQDPPVVVNRVNITTPYPGGQNTYAAMGPQYDTASASGFTNGPASYAPTPSPQLSARYAPPPARPRAPTQYDMSMYGSSTPSGVRQGIHFGPVEGTADIIMSPAAAGVTGFSAGYGPVGQAYPPAQPRSAAPQGNPAYSGGAYPTVTATIPATYAPASASPAPASAAAAPASYGAGEIRLIPAPDVPPGFHPNDAGPSQWFEIVRPGNGPLRIGRVSATCVCVGVRVPKRHIAAGERALVEARIVSRPQVNNLTYGIYVNIVEPQQTVVDADVTINL